MTAAAPSTGLVTCSSTMRSRSRSSSSMVSSRATSCSARSGSFAGSQCTRRCRPCAKDSRSMTTTTRSSWTGSKARTLPTCSTNVGRRASRRRQWWSTCARSRPRSTISIATAPRSCTATSSRRTSCSRRSATSCSSISGSRTRWVRRSTRARSGTSRPRSGGVRRAHRLPMYTALPRRPTRC